ncbi:MAG: LPD25 domain-containing protein [Mediterraneibacter gnavus]
MGGEEFNYEGRFDIGDGEGDLLAHIRNFYEYSSPPTVRLSQNGNGRARIITGSRWKPCVSDRDVFIPFLERSTPS